MKLNPVYDFIKNHDEFTYADVITGCQELVVSTHYLENAFHYIANEALIKQVDAPMPEKVVVGHRVVEGSYGEVDKDMMIIKEPDYENIYGYSVYGYNARPEFFKMGKFHKTTEWKKEFKNMKNPFLTSPVGMLVDFESKEFKDKYFTNHKTYNNKKPREKWSDLSWEEVAERTKGEVERALYYIAVHNFGSTRGFELRPHDRKHQWQRVVDLGVEYQALWYKCFDEKCKWSPEKKAFEMFKMHWMVDSETENMC